MPLASNVMRTSIVALAASFGLRDRFGAKAEDKTLAISSLDHVEVMLSGKSLDEMSVSSIGERAREHIRAIKDENIVFISQP